MIINSRLTYLKIDDLSTGLEISKFVKHEASGNVSVANTTIVFALNLTASLPRIKN